LIDPSSRSNVELEMGRLFHRQENWGIFESWRLSLQSILKSSTNENFRSICSKIQG